MQINNSLCTADTVCIYDASTNERKPNQKYLVMLEVLMRQTKHTRKHTERMKEGKHFQPGSHTHAKPALWDC